MMPIPMPSSPRIGQLVAKDRDSYQYLVESIRKFPRQAELVRRNGTGWIQTRPFREFKFRDSGHPSGLEGLTMRSLAGKRILLIISGGIAAYKSLELTRLIQREGGKVRGLLTQGRCAVRHGAQRGVANRRSMLHRFVVAERRGRNGPYPPVPARPI